MQHVISEMDCEIELLSSCLIESTLEETRKGTDGGDHASGKGDASSGAGHSGDKAADNGTRYRARLELSGRETAKVIAAIDKSVIG